MFHVNRCYTEKVTFCILYFTRKWFFHRVESFCVHSKGYFIDFIALIPFDAEHFVDPTGKISARMKKDLNQVQMIEKLFFARRVENRF